MWGEQTNDRYYDIINAPVATAHDHNLVCHEETLEISAKEFWPAELLLWRFFGCIHRPPWDSLSEHLSRPINKSGDTLNKRTSRTNGRWWPVKNPVIILGAKWSWPKVFEKFCTWQLFLLLRTVRFPGREVVAQTKLSSSRLLVGHFRGQLYIYFI